MSEVVTKLEHSQEVAERPTNSADAIISVIERAVSNPDVDIDKMERLLAMQERVLTRQAQMDFAAAMARMQPELPIIGERGAIKDNNGKVRNTYAYWEDINEQIKPILAKHGFSLDFRSETTDEGKMIIVAMLTHEHGHTKEAKSPPLVADTSGSKNNIQALGSSQSYGQRYSAKLVLNLTSRGEDDDGEAGGQGKTITDAQCNELLALAEEVEAVKPNFIKALSKRTNTNIDGFANIPAKHYQTAKDLLNSKRGKAAK